MRGLRGLAKVGVAGHDGKSSVGRNDTRTKTELARF